jgi:hypothetical protein
VRPFRRNQAPRSASDTPAASVTAASFSSGLQSSGRLALGFVVSSSFTPANLLAAFSQSDKVGCGTPTSRESAQAETFPGPVIRPTILALNLSE